MHAALAPSTPDDRVERGIVTPEAVVLDLRTAGIASRLCAGLIDLLLMVVALWMLLLVTAMSGLLDGGSTSTTVTAIVVFALVFGYPIAWETLSRGRTIGKQAMGIRAVTVEGAPIRLRHASLRAMGGVADKFFVPLIGIVMILASRRHQRIGDMIAGTIVIRDPERYVTPPALWFPVPWGLEAYAATLDPSAVTVEQYTLVRSFLTRVSSLTPAARGALAAELAARLEATIGAERPPHVHPESFLLAVLARYQRRQFPEYQPAQWQPPAAAVPR
jgi:uncharacterized RDD family membrane protein YckC